MATLEELPPDQRAVLALVLKQGKGYAEIAGLLGLDEQAVRDRAHAALGALAPRGGTAPPAARRDSLADYLLGQQPDEEAQHTRNYLASSASGRAWARVVAGALRPIGDKRLPEIPGGRGDGDAAAPALAQAAAPAAGSAAAPSLAPGAGSAGQTPPSDRGRRAAARSSRRGGAILLAIVAAAVIALIVVLSSGGGAAKRKPRRAATGATAGQPQIIGQVNLKSPSGGASPIGIALIVVQGNTPYLGLQAQGLAAAPRGAYGVWLYNSHSSAYAIGAAPAVTSAGRLSAVAPLPATTASYRAVIVTRETSARPTRPGPIVLSGPLPGHTTGH